MVTCAPFHPGTLHLEPDASLHATHATFNGVGVTLGDTNGPTPPPDDPTDYAHGEVTDSTLTNANVSMKPASLDWRRNTFTNTPFSETYGTPMVVGNAFSGVERPVHFERAADLSGISGNSASGPELNRVFDYNVSHVTGHWTPEPASSGVIHEAAISIEPGGNMDLPAGARVDIDYAIDVQPGGTLTATGTTTNPVLFQSACGREAECTSFNRVQLYADANLHATHATFNGVGVTLGDTNGPTPPPDDPTDYAHGEVTDSTLTNANVSMKPASLDWRRNTFTNTPFSETYGTPMVVGNAFSGVERPVHFERAADLSGISGNSASGPELNRVFDYNVSHVTGHWTPEPASSGVIHEAAISIEPGGNMDLPAGARVDIDYAIDVQPGGTLTATGTTTNPVLFQSACGREAECTSFNRVQLYADANLHATHATFNGVGVTLGDTNGPTPPPDDPTDYAHGEVTDSTLTNANVSMKPASLDWRRNTFTNTPFSETYGTPMVVGNAFSGVERPVHFERAADLSGISGNSASGPELNRVFDYNVSHVTGHWTPEPASSGVIHEAAISIEPGGNMDLPAGARVDIDYAIDVQPGGTLTATGTTTNPVLFQSACGREAECTSFNRVQLYADANLHATHATFNGVGVTLGDTNGPTPPPDDPTDYAHGEVTDSTLTNANVSMKPASLDWRRNTFTNTPFSASLGSALTLDTNTWRQSTASLTQVLQPRIMKNKWKSTSVPLTISGAGDLSGIAPNNSATGATDDQRRLVLNGSVVKPRTTLNLGTRSITELNSLIVLGTVNAPKGAVIDLSSDLTLSAGSKFVANQTTIRSKDGSTGYEVDARAGSLVSIKASAIEGGVRGSCAQPYLGGANISVSQTAFTGVARFENCNTEATNGPKATSLGNTGVSYSSHHADTCVWKDPATDPQPPPYDVTIYDVFSGTPDESCAIGYQLFPDTSPHY